MARKRNTRMFSREQRREARLEQLARARTVTQSGIDEQLIEAYLGTCAAWTSEIAGAWLALRSEEDRTELEARVLDAMGRELRRRTGRSASRELVEELEARRDEELIEEYGGDDDAYWGRR